MIALASNARIFAYAAPCDMRKSSLTLSALVVDMGEDIFAGSVYVFVAKNRKRAKLLRHDGTGLCVLAKKLDDGCFAPL